MGALKRPREKRARPSHLAPLNSRVACFTLHASAVYVVSVNPCRYVGRILMSEWVNEAVEEDKQTEKNQREVDKEYLALLERKLHSVKNPSGKKATAKQFISDIASVKDHQLFNLLTTESTDNKLEDDSVDQVIQPSLIRLKLAPQTCAVATSEKLKLVRNDHVQRIRDLLDQLNEEGQEGNKTAIDSVRAQFEEILGERPEKEKEEDWPEEEQEDKKTKEDWTQFEEHEETVEKDKKE